MIDQSSRDALSNLPRAVVFVKVVMSGSFRGAAESLGVAPATVSHHIKELEASMSVRLLERSTRKMSLTSAGRAFYSELRAALSCCERGVGAAQRFKEAASGCIVVSAPDVWTQSVVIPAVRELVKTNPDVTVDLRVSSRMSDLLAEGVHVALRAGPLPDSSYGSRLLHRADHGIFCTNALREAWRAAHPRDLVSAPWVHFRPRPHPTRLNCINLPSFDLNYTPTISSDSPQGAIEFAAQGLGFILLPRILATESLTPRGLVQVLPEWTGDPIEFHAVMPSPRTTDRKVQLFVDLVAKQFKDAEAQL